nr:lysophospholipid acyltransferase family protein [Corynebacterium sp. TAE3-ERU12]
MIGPWLWVWNRPRHSGFDKLPDEGPVILASNHLSVMDSFFLPLVLKRELTFLAKKEYFTGTGIKGAVQRFFFHCLNQVPIDRTSGDAAKDALNAGLKVLARGEVLGMYPEGTRSHDGRLYKGKTGLARVALNSGAKVYPLAMFDSEKANPIGTWVPRPVKVGLLIGDPLDPADYRDRGDEYHCARAMTDDLMATLQQMSGQTYVAAYSADVKNSLAAGEGYPEGAEPGGELETPPPPGAGSFWTKR